MVNKSTPKNIDYSDLYKLIGKRRPVGKKAFVRASIHRDICNLLSVEKIGDIKNKDIKDIANYCHRVNAIKIEEAEKQLKYKLMKAERDKKESQKKNKDWVEEEVKEPRVNANLLNPYHVHAVMTRAMYDYKLKPVKADFERKQFRDWINSEKWREHIEDTNYFCKDLPKILSKFGVALILLPDVGNSGYGFLEWADGHPLICINDKFKDLAYCWVMFLHLAHHAFDIFCEGVTKLEADFIKHEKEYHIRDDHANHFVYETIFKGYELQRLIKESCGFGLDAGKVSKIRERAQELNVEPFFLDFLIRRYRSDFRNKKRCPVNFQNILSKFICKKKMEGKAVDIFRKNLVYVMGEKGVSRKDLADALKISKGQVTNLLNYKRDFSSKCMYAICDYLNVSIGEMHEPDFTYGQFNDDDSEDVLPEPLTIDLKF